MTIGLTGVSGSGKSEVSRIMKNNGAFVIDCDAIAHRNMAPDGAAYDEIADFFGRDILKEDKTIDRKKLGGIVFSDREKLAVLNSITHKYIKAEVLRLIDGHKKEKCVVIDAPLLFEAGLEKYCAEVWGVYAPYLQRLERITKRDGISPSMAKKRFENQADGESLMKLCDVVIENDSTLEYLEKKVMTEMKNKELI